MTNFKSKNRLLFAQNSAWDFGRLLAGVQAKSWVIPGFFTTVVFSTFFTSALAQALPLGKLASTAQEPKWVVMGKNLAGETLSLDINSPLYTKPKHPPNTPISPRHLPTDNRLGETTFTLKVLSRAGTRIYNAGTSSCNFNEAKTYRTSSYRESWTVFNLGQFQTIPANSPASLEMLKVVCKTARGNHTH